MKLFLHNSLKLRRFPAYVRRPNLSLLLVFRHILSSFPTCFCYYVKNLLCARRDLHFQRIFLNVSKHPHI
ncbi:hypothetical protein CW304_15405 [Bacillus sp. UFRGS-B20]|nr:hypothetical protein CW304_15405 [Bacillus sp. UFRGS-B20]